MLRGFLKMFIPCLILVLVLAAAKYMDSGAFFHKTAQSTEKPPVSTQEAETEATTEPTETETATQPVETEPTETEPAETEPAETEPAQTEPAETEPAETEPVVTEPEETEPAKTEPSEQEPTQTEQTLPPETEAAKPQAAQRPENTFLFTFVGDCTFGATPSNYYATVGFAKTVGSDYQYPFVNVYDYMAADDFTFLNLEGPLTDEGNPTEGKFIFRGPAEYVNILSQNSVEAVSLSNNHIMDYGKTGYDATRTALDNVHVSYVEQDNIRVVVLENGLKIGLYATMYTKVDREELVNQIRNLKDMDVDVIVYAPHWGTEGSYTISAEQEELAHIAIDAGAHIVYGSHPHVLQPIEEYNGGVIFYSMGNFSFGGNTMPRDMDTALVQQELTVLEDGTVQLGERLILPCSISSNKWQNNYQPTPYASGTHEYERVLKKLSGTYEGGNLPIGEQ